MKLPTVFGLILLVGLVSAAPVSEENNDKVVITKLSYPYSFVVYSGEHEIVKIIVPLNALNLGENTDDKYLFFFVEADDDEFGNRIDRGIYVFKNGNVKKLLENGRDAAAATDDSEDVFIAADDGIYLYDDNEVSVSKYGSVSDSIIGIEKATGIDLIYILTEDKEVYKVTENGEKKQKVNEISSAEQIVLDYANNLFYVDADNQPYVYNFETEEVKLIEGTPEDAIKVQLVKPPIYSESKIPFVVDEKVYIINADGSAELYDKIELDADGKPSAYALEAAYTQFYAIDKQIYEFNVYELVLNVINGVLNDLLVKYVAIGQELLSLLGFFNWY